MIPFLLAATLLIPRTGMSDLSLWDCNPDSRRFCAPHVLAWSEVARIEVVITTLDSPNWTDPTWLTNMDSAGNGRMNVYVWRSRLNRQLCPVQTMAIGVGPGHTQMFEIDLRNFTAGDFLLFESRPWFELRFRVFRVGSSEPVVDGSLPMRASNRIEVQPLGGTWVGTAVSVGCQ